MEQLRNLVQPILLKSYFKSSWRLRLRRGISVSFKKLLNIETLFSGVLRWKKLYIIFLDGLKYAPIKLWISKRFYFGDIIKFPQSLFLYVSWVFFGGKNWISAQ